MTAGKDDQMPTDRNENWIQGDAKSKKAAIANAVLNAEEINPRPGMKILIDVQTVWKDQDGRYHAKVLFQEVPDREQQNEMIQKPAADDHLTDPANDDKSHALESTEHMEQAEKMVEVDFDHASHEKSGRDKEPKPETPGEQEAMTAKTKVENRKADNPELNIDGSGSGDQTRK